MPALLPAELLESDSEDDAAAEAALREAAAKRRKKITFGSAGRALDRAARPPPDRRVGTTVYRPLVEARDAQLVPRANKHSIARKRELLARGRATMPQRKGFFVKKR